jgi:hypothetical protein|tara:strand:+ start:7 stop:228 length:222 start_codon:yes stop_codon:yes gene_type:complete
MFTKEFWKDAGERAIKTLAQTFLALAAAEGIFDVFVSDWQAVLGTSIGAGLLSLATSLVSARYGPKKDTPSLV